MKSQLNIIFLLYSLWALLGLNGLETGVENPACLREAAGSQMSSSKTSPRNPESFREQSIFKYHLTVRRSIHLTLGLISGGCTRLRLLAWRALKPLGARTAASWCGPRALTPAQLQAREPPPAQHTVINSTFLCHQEYDPNAQPCFDCAPSRAQPLLQAAPKAKRRISTLPWSPCFSWAPGGFNHRSWVAYLCVFVLNEAGEDEPYKALVHHLIHGLCADVYRQRNERRRIALVTWRAGKGFPGSEGWPWNLRTVLCFI